MPRRQRWQPVKGTGNRVYDPAERALVGLIDAPGRLLSVLRPPRAPAPGPLREVLVLRLDRIGDVLMSLPAMADLRAALPDARIRLAVGRWSEEAARSAPVDELLVWSAPWAGRPHEGGEGFPALWKKARALRAARLDLALDLQGDLRANFLMRATGARHRVGYANTGGGHLLSRVVPLDETVPWVEQNRRAVAAAVGVAPGTASVAVLTDADLAFARAFLGERGLLARRPLVGIHPSGGRRVKQWDVARWAEVAARLQRELGATVLVTGSAADEALAEPLVRAGAIDLTGRLGLREMMAVVGALDLFLSPDTGPMHIACAVGTPSLSVFGPSDPARYFSGAGPRHVVVRPELWCSPCNLIRRPPAECAGVEAPECLRLVTVDEVYAKAAGLLRAS